MTPTKQRRTKTERYGLAAAFTAISLGATLAVIAGLPTLSHAETTMAEMTEEQIKSQVAERYRAVFQKLYIQNPIDHSYVPMTPIPAKDFKITGETETGWSVAHDPLAGVIVRATVSKGTGFVQFDAVDLAVE